MHAPDGAGAGNRNRTYDLIITNDALYQLSYSGEGAEYRQSRGRGQPEAAHRSTRILPAATHRRAGSAGAFCSGMGNCERAATICDLWTCRYRSKRVCVSCEVGYRTGKRVSDRGSRARRLREWKRETDVGPVDGVLTLQQLRQLKQIRLRLRPPSFPHVLRVTRHRDRRQDRDDCHNDHQLDEREAVY